MKPRTVTDKILLPKEAEEYREHEGGGTSSTSFFTAKEMCVLFFYN
jgi:hypothetical protein